MRQDLSISSLFQKVNALQKLKHDYLVPTKELTVTSNSGITDLNIEGKGYMLQQRAAVQLASAVRMPFSYYQRLSKSYPQLLDDNLNTLLADIEKPRLVRTLGNSARAVLSDHYKKIEHEDILNTVIPLVDNINGMEIVSCSLNDERLYLKAICKYEKADVKVGDEVSFGFVCTNSEVGTSSVIIQPYVERLVCTNGMVLPSYYESQRKIHLGKKITDIEVFNGSCDYNPEDLSNTIKGQLNKILCSSYYNSVVKKMRYATEIFIQDAAATLDKVCKLYSLDEKERELIQYHFTLSKDNTLWSLVNAITESSKASLTYERAHQLEVIGSRLLYDGVDSMEAKSNDLFLTA